MLPAVHHGMLPLHLTLAGAYMLGYAIAMTYVYYATAMSYPRHTATDAC